MRSADYRRLVLKVCSRCGEKPLAVTSKWLCDDCLIKGAEYHMEKYYSRTEEEKELSRETWRQNYKKRRESGKCSRCRNMARPGKALCLQCAIHNQQKYERAKYGRTDV